MTKAEFLELKAGQQRWILLRTIRMAFWLLIAGPLKEGRAEAFKIVKLEADIAAKEVTDDQR